MQTRITARHFKANPDLQNHAEISVAKLERFFDGITDVHIILEKNGTSSAEKTAEISLNVYKQTLTATDTAPTHTEAINRCVSNLKRQVLRYKQKLRGKRHNDVTARA